MSSQMPPRPRRLRLPDARHLTAKPRSPRPTEDDSRRVRPAPQRAWRLRSLPLAFAVLATACADSRNAGAKENTAAAPPGYVFVEGPAAVRFLTGKTVVDPVAFQHQTARYFIDAATVLQSNLEPGHPLLGGLKIGRFCFISPWKVTDTEDCGNQSRLISPLTKCVPFRMLAAQSTKDQTGALRGYFWLDYLKGVSDIPFSKDEASTIVEGNVTGCPLGTPPTSVDAIELPETDDSISLESPTPFKDGKISPAALVQHVLVGNSIVWPKSEGEECAHTDYFSPDGLVYSLSCESAGQSKTPPLPRLSDRPALTLVTTSWKLIDGKFCLDNVEADGVFDQCDPYLLSAFIARSVTSEAVTKHVHAYFIFGSSNIEPRDNRPGLIVPGNPAGFRPHP